MRDGRSGLRRARHSLRDYLGDSSRQQPAIGRPGCALSRARGMGGANGARRHRDGSPRRRPGRNAFDAPQPRERVCRARRRARAVACRHFRGSGNSSAPAIPAWRARGDRRPGRTRSGAGPQQSRRPVRSRTHAKGAGRLRLARSGGRGDIRRSSRRRRGGTRIWSAPSLAGAGHRERRRMPLPAAASPPAGIADRRKDRFFPGQVPAWARCRSPGGSAA